MKSIVQKAQEILDLADVKINGDRPWDIQVKNEEFYARVMRGGSLALGESCMDGWWEVEKMDELFTKLLSADLHTKVQSFSNLGYYLAALLTNRQNTKRAFHIGEKHYDLGNDLYQAMLDPRLVYTCGYWKNAKNLAEAQEAKLDLVCKKIGLKAGDKVLDIGCGWGSFAKFAAEKYGASVVGVTVSKEQKDLAHECCNALPIEIRLQDYRQINEKFDHIISLGMFEHVGYKNYRTYMEVAARCLKDDGLFLLHTIGSNISGKVNEPWIEKYIFPNSIIPSMKQIATASEGVFVTEDWHNFGTDYDKTLMAWFENFDSRWDQLKEKYSDRFYRMWKYYLLSCAGSFRSRTNQLWQIVYSKNGVKGGYKSIR